MLQYVNNVDVADSNGGEIAIHQIELKFLGNKDNINDNHKQMECMTPVLINGG